MSTQAVFGFVRDQASIRRVLDDLVGSGFAPDEISVLVPSRGVVLDLQNRDVTDLAWALARRAGAAAVGGTSRLLDGVRTLAIPGFGPLLAAGPVFGALGGNGAPRSLGGALLDLGFSDLQSRRFEANLRAGKLLVAVHGRDAPRIATATDVLDAHGASEMAIASRPGEPRGREGYEDAGD